MGYYLSRTICALVFAQAFVFGNSLFAQFLVPTNGPEGGAVSGVTELSNGNLYASVGNEGIVESNDSGESWHPIESQPESGLGYLISDQQDRLFGLSHNSVFRLDSLNGEWQETAELPVPAHPGDWYLNKLIVDSADRLFAAMSFNYDDRWVIFTSDNHGNSWQMLADTPFDSVEFTLHDLAVDNLGQLWVVGTKSYADPDRYRLYKSNPEFTSWTEFQLAPGDHSWFWKVVPDGSGFVFVNTDGGVSRYNLDTQQWTDLTPVAGEFRHLHSTNITGSIFTEQEDGTYESQDHGDSWIRIGECSPVYPWDSFVDSEENYILGTIPLAYLDSPGKRRNGHLPIADLSRQA